MKLLLVLGTNDNCDTISQSIRPLGFELIRYNNIFKAMDNIDEIDPDVIVISARDFPRHWNILVQFVRYHRAREICPIIILKGENFNNEDTSKAFLIGVSGVVNDDLNNPEEISRLQNILSRFVPVHEQRKHHRFFVEPWSRIGFLMNVPGNYLVSGEVKTISSGGLSFIPDESMPPEGIAVNTELNECSLRAGDAILSPVSHVIHTGNILSLEFISFPDNEQQILDQYLDEYPLMEALFEKAG